MSFALLLAAASATVAPYGVTKDGRAVEQVTLANDRGMTVKIIGYGATVTDIVVPDRAGKPANVALGFATLREYEERNGDYAFGATVGRYSGRIANARFSIDGKEVKLTANDGPNALHGGPGAWFEKVWTVTPVRRGRDVGAVFRYSSADGEQNFPGRVDVSVTYTLTPDNALRIEYEARSDKATVVNFTNHSYFNLKGAGSGSVLAHRLRVHSARLLETDQGGIPTGRFLPVAGTPFDFRRAAVIGDRMKLPHPQMEGRRGFNHSWVLPWGGRLRRAATLSDPESGREMEVLTTEPSLVVYTGNWFSGRDKGAQGTVYRPHDAVALETQHLPDSPNRPEFPSTALRPGEVFRSTTIYRFSAKRR